MRIDDAIPQSDVLVTEGDRLAVGIVIKWDVDGRGFMWKHPVTPKYPCRAWSTLRFAPDPKSTGHALVGGGREDVGALTLKGSLLCPGCCGFHGLIENGRWVPA